MKSVLKHYICTSVKTHPRHDLRALLTLNLSIYLKYEEIKNCEKIMSWGVYSHKRNDVDLQPAEPTAAPAIRPPIVITVAFPAGISLSLAGDKGGLLMGDR